MTGSIADTQVVIDDTGRNDFGGNDGTNTRCLQRRSDCFRDVGLITENHMYQKEDLGSSVYKNKRPEKETDWKHQIQWKIYVLLRKKLIT